MDAAMEKFGKLTALKMLRSVMTLRVRFPLAVQQLCDTQLGS